MFTVNELSDKLKSDLKGELLQDKQIASIILDAMINYLNLGDAQVDHLKLKDIRLSFKYLQFVSDESLWYGAKYIIEIAFEDVIQIN